MYKTKTPLKSSLKSLKLSRFHMDGPLAQSAAHGADNAKVVSSILTRTTKITFFPFHVKEFYFKK